MGVLWSGCNFGVEVDGRKAHLTAWDLGVGLGVLIGGQIAEVSNYATVYATACVLCAIGYVLFKMKTAAHFENHKLR